MTRPLNASREPADAALEFNLPLFDTTRRIELIPAPPLRTITLHQQVIEYRLTRSSRRTIGFLVDDRGLTLTAPRWVTLASIEAALQEKANWILRKLDEWREHAKRRERLVICWQDGQSLSYLGETLKMRCQVAAHVNVERQHDVLQISLPAEAPADAIQAVVMRWLHGQARELFNERINHYGELLGAYPTQWTLSSARTRWGSCGADGAIRLNWRLMYFPISIIDYVVVHELAHLKEMNHSARFWAIVERLYPNYQEARKWLRRYPDDLSSR